jgi:hypothetical protein
MGIEAAAIVGGAGLLGSAMAGRSAEKAARTSANAQLEAARIAAEEQRFRPVGITSRFGTSQFGFGPEGRLESAGYTASPEIQALQARLAGLYGSSLGLAETAPQTSQGLFNLGQQYLAQTPDQARRQYLQEQYALLDPMRAAEEQRLGASVFARGRAGLNIGGGGQPELAALAGARRTQDLQLAAQAEQEARNRIGFGTGLLGTGIDLQTKALAPFQQQFGVSQLLEQAAQQPLDIGAQLGGRAATAGANVGQSLLAGGMGAAQTQLQGSLVGPSLMAQNISSAGQQFLRGQQQQQLFSQLYGPSSPAGLQATYGFNPFSNTNPFAQASQAGQYGTS